MDSVRQAIPSTRGVMSRRIVALLLAANFGLGASALNAAPVPFKGQVQDKPATTPALVPDDQNRFLRFLNTSAPQYTDNLPYPQPAIPPAAAESIAAQTPVVEAYYKAIDPDNSKATLAGFHTANGYSAGIDALAVYVNDADLGFGRRMDVRTNPDGSIASCVANYGGNSVPPAVNDPDAEKLANAEVGGLKGLIATVCMEYSGTPGAYVPAPPPSTTLLAYNNNISRTNRNSRITMTLQPGTYRVVAATYAPNKAGQFLITAAENGVVLLNSLGNWTNSAGQSYTSPNNPSYPLTITTAGKVTINLTSAVDTYLYLLKETAGVPNAQLSGRKFTKFYVYGADANQSRLLFADLDGRGAKAVPTVCNVCHGGAPSQLENGVYPKNGDTGAQWLPWDLDNLVYDNSAGSTFTRAAQESKFKILNQSVLATYPQNPKTVSWTGQVDIPDNPVPYATVDIPLTVANVTGPISQVILSFDGDAANPGLAHPDIADLNVDVVAPDGTAYNMFWCTTTVNTGAGLYQAYFSTEGGAAPMFRKTDILGPNPSSGNFFAPGLQYFAGLNPNGVWKLRVGDCKTGKTGRVTAWSLHFNGTPDAAYLPAPVELIRGWYGGTSAANPTPNATFNGKFVPKGWQVPPVVVNGQTLNPSDLYTQVVAPACRACHVQRGSMRRNEIDFSTYDKFIKVYGKRIVDLVYDKSLMPLARRTYQNHFWSKNGSTLNAPAEVLARFMGVDINARKPGRPLADAGPSRLPVSYINDLLPQPGSEVTLNGGASAFAETFQWQFASKPATSSAVLTGASTTAPRFTPDVDGTYDISLIVTRTVNGSPVASSPSHVLVKRDSTIPTSSYAPSPLQFSTNVFSFLGYRFCTQCHNQMMGNVPPFSLYAAGNTLTDVDIAYGSAIQLIDLNDPLNSALVRKMSGELPHVGGSLADALVVNEPFYFGRFYEFLRWILDGAPK